MKSSVIVSAVLLGGLAATSVEAMPIAKSATTESVSSVVTVDYACGRGWHATPWGECRPNAWRGPPPRYWGRRPPPPYGWGYYRPRYYGWHYGPRW
ncbi:GCG_CRPN prefix-to-repeats domain-containing protein [Rhizobium tubonense]|uniref:Uncharacterized protein n=1 Tax=Rhizobium tubonense TaxID=484088 RepID=A0A2W4CTW7_9HYPH|nr:hypothetical protein [Rhizobium tubonense]PZM16097.1 hypothetical protein CPY51_05310 [Rhizobium tubonense]